MNKALLNKVHFVDILKISHFVRLFQHFVANKVEKKRKFDKIPSFCEIS
jgi:hypothetical protein